MKKYSITEKGEKFLNEERNGFVHDELMIFDKYGPLSETDLAMAGIHDSMLLDILIRDGLVSDIEV